MHIQPVLRWYWEEAVASKQFSAPANTRKYNPDHSSSYEGNERKGLGQFRTPINPNTVLPSTSRWAILRVKIRQIWLQGS